MTAAYGQSAIKPYYYYKKSIDTLERWYVQPKIEISLLLDSIWHKEKVVSFEKYIDANGSLVHELVHYYQQTYIAEENYVEASVENWQTHIMQPQEFEAYTVESYYFLSIVNRPLLKQIFRKKHPALERNKNLINEVNSILHPGAVQLIVK